MLYLRSGTLPGNTITNPKEDLKGITTRSGVTIQGPKAVNHDTEVTKDTMPPANNGSTEDVQPPVVQIQTRNPNPDPYLSFEISFTDALMLMPKFASTLKTLIGNKEKLSELARTPLNENCSAVILNKLPKKLGDPGRFLIPCEFTGITTCNALADLGASINLMPYSVWKDLALPELTPTCMTLRASRIVQSLNQLVIDFQTWSRVAIPTPYVEPIVSLGFSNTLTPSGTSDFLLMEEADSFLCSRR
ncbi:reverse transcriptase domain-containing protein [Tanacetum coccineum]|uniref:Reverse transcriptase domain-containing protein n=1 Tax=Tanacetum coccineum TaxID=301880 RepID=A0ABQ4Z2H9_9ASTR